MLFSVAATLGPGGLGLTQVWATLQHIGELLLARPSSLRYYRHKRNVVFNTRYVGGPSQFAANLAMHPQHQVVLCYSLGNFRLGFLPHPILWYI